LEDYFVILV